MSGRENETTLIQMAGSCQGTMSLYSKHFLSNPGEKEGMCSHDTHTHTRITVANVKSNTNSFAPLVFIHFTGCQRKISKTKKRPGLTLPWGLTTFSDTSYGVGRGVVVVGEPAQPLETFHFYKK